MPDQRQPILYKVIHLSSNSNLNFSATPKMKSKTLNSKIIQFYSLYFYIYSVSLLKISKILILIISVENYFGRKQILVQIKE